MCPCHVPEMKGMKKKTLSEMSSLQRSTDASTVTHGAIFLLGCAYMKNYNLDYFKMRQKIYTVAN